MARSFIINRMNTKMNSDLPPLTILISPSKTYPGSLNEFELINDDVILK